jgi:hypothetical protein
MIYIIIYLAVLSIALTTRIPYDQAGKNIRPNLENFPGFLNLIGLIAIPMLFAIALAPPSLFRPLPDFIVIGSGLILAASLFLFYIVHKTLGKNRMHFTKAEN